MTRWGWRCLALVVVVRVAIAVLFPVMPEEAYHWNFARHPDWGYYDHPPMVAWGIGFGTFLVGDNRLGVRLGPLLFSVGTTLVLACLARRLYGPKAADWSILLLALEPAVGVASWGFPDSPLLFFWALTLLAVWQAVESGRGGWWLAAGAALGAGMLSKYTAAFLVPSVLGYLCFSRRDRRWLATPWPYLAGVVSLVVFLPVIYWNWQHDWASFHFQGASRFSKANNFSIVDGMLSASEHWVFILPITLPLAAAAFIGLVRTRQVREQFLFWSFAPTTFFFLAMGTTPSYHLLWALPAYLGLTVAMAGTVAEPTNWISSIYAARPGWLAGSFVAVLVGAAVYASGVVPFVPLVDGADGWEAIAKRARQEAGKLPADSFYVGISSRPYVCASELAYYLGLPKNVEANNVLGLPGLQFQFWTDSRGLAGHDALIVAEGAMYMPMAQLLPECFDSFETIGEVVADSGSRSRPLHCFFYRGHGYRPPAKPRY